MKRFSKLILPLLGTLIMSGCVQFSFEDDCTYSGNLQLRLEWDEFWGKLAHPSSLQGIFYLPSASPRVESISGDALIKDLPSGSISMLFYNRLPGVDYRDLEVREKGEIYLPTRFEGNIRYVDSAPLLCSYAGDVTIPIDATVHKIINPKPLGQQIIFSVYLTKDDAAMVRQLDADLSGVSTGYSLAKNEAIRSKANIRFPLKEVNTQPLLYSNQVHVLGVNPPRPGEEPIAKKLALRLMLESGQEMATELDLTGQLDRFTGRVCHCTLALRIVSTSLFVEISGWEEGDWKDGSIQ